MAGVEPTPHAPAVADYCDVNLWDPATFAAGVPHDASAVLRAHPIFLNSPKRLPVRLR